MKILWIEDFGVKQQSKIVVEIFKEFFKDLELSQVYDSDNADVTGQLGGLFSKHTVHEVFVCKSYVDWKKIDKEQDGDFDIALIDINLESDPTPDVERPAGFDSPEFDKKAGFYIYHQMIKRGFPDDNIAFFTAEGQSLKEFSLFCGDIFLDKPAHCFQKNQANFKQLRGWLAEKTSQQSLILRRGVIEGCRFVKEKIAAIESSSLENRLIFYKTLAGNTTGDAEALRRDSIDYLSRLERYFRAYRSYDNRDLTNLFIRELAAKWEESRGFFIRSKTAPQFGAWLEEQFHRTAQFQMKMLRNWSSHHLLSPHPGAKETAYFFILAMRALIATELNEVFRYEEILSTLFEQISELELKRRMNSDFELRLEESYEKLKALHAEISRHVDDSSRERMGQLNHDRRMENYFLAIFRETGEAAKWLKSDNRLYCLSRIRQCSIDLFYQSFWHGLFPMEIKTTYYANLQKIKFYTQPLSPSFVSFLGRTIFEECFKDADTANYIAQPRTIPITPNNRR